MIVRKLSANTFSITMSKGERTEMEKAAKLRNLDLQRFIATALQVAVEATLEETP